MSNYNDNYDDERVQRIFDAFIKVLAFSAIVIAIFLIIALIE